MVVLVLLMVGSLADARPGVTNWLVMVKTTNNGEKNNQLRSSVHWIPSRTWQVSSFQVEIEFKALCPSPILVLLVYLTTTHLQITSKSAHLFGDGMAIWLTSRRAEPGPVFGFESKLFVSHYPRSNLISLSFRQIWRTWDIYWYVCHSKTSDVKNIVFIGLNRFANGRHPYGFPRIVGMIGDGNTQYDNGSDGDGQAAGACTVSLPNFIFTYY